MNDFNLKAVLFLIKINKFPIFSILLHYVFAKTAIFKLYKI